MARQRTEDALQRAVLAWLELAHPAAFLATFHVPNGGGRTTVEGALLKGLGVRPGVPDLLTVWRVGGRPGAALELKAPGRRPRPSQAAWIEHFASQGWATGWARTLDEAIRFYTLFFAGAPLTQGPGSGGSGSAPASSESTPSAAPQ